MPEFITNPGGGQLILIPHLIVFYVAYSRWLQKEIEWSFWPIVLDVFGAVSSLIALVLSVFFLFDVDRGSLGSNAAWYLIYAAITLGLFVLLTHTVFYLSGRFIGRMRQIWRIRNLGKNLGRQDEKAY